MSAFPQDILFDMLYGHADTEAVVLVSSALSKNGVFYVMPTLSTSSNTAYILTKISDRIRCCGPHDVLFVFIMLNIAC